MSFPRIRRDLTLAAAWLVVEKVQRHHPGWRFSLLGGDESWGYKRKSNTRDGDAYTVDKTVRHAFGWCARFFGEEDPTIDFGDTHGESLHEDAAAFAICLAALRAVDA